MIELAEWDYDMQASSAAALIFEIMFMELNLAMFEDELADKYSLLAYEAIAKNLIEKTRITGQSLWCDNVNTPDIQESFHDNIRTAFQHTVDTLSSMYGPEVSTWEWGQLHKIALMHPLGTVNIVEKLFKVNRGPYSIGGRHSVMRGNHPSYQAADSCLAAW